MSTEKKIYVSPLGCDTNHGMDSKSPFASIGRAREAIHALPIELRKGIQIILMDGVHYLDQTFCLNGEDSAGGDGTIYFCAEHPGKAIISGGKRITGWQHWKDGIYCVPTGDMAFRQLYVNGQAAVRCRFPKNEVHKNEGVLYWDGPNWNPDGMPKKFQLKMAVSLAHSLADCSQVEFCAHTTWGCNYIRLESVSSVESDGFVFVEIRPEEYEILASKVAPSFESDGVGWLENDLSFLTEENEWFLDRKQKMLYYKPPVGEDMDKLDVVIPHTETLVCVEGTRNHPVENLVFEGIAFRYSNWTKPDERGYIDIQAGIQVVKHFWHNIQYVEKMPAAFCLRHTRNVQIRNCVFSQLGANALDLDIGTQNTVVEGNLILDISGSGIVVGPFSDRTGNAHIPYVPEDGRDVVLHTKISNNLITRTGQHYHGCIPIMGGYPRHIEISHNRISDVYYSAISVGWGWTQAENVMEGTQILFNEIFRIGTSLCDGAAIYTLSPQPHSKIHGNYIHDLAKKWKLERGPVCGIYLDGGSKGFTITDNTFQNLAEDVLAYFIVCDTTDNTLRASWCFEERIAQEAGLEAAYRYLIPMAEAKMVRDFQSLQKGD